MSGGNAPAVFLCSDLEDNQSPDPARRWLERLRVHLRALALQGEVRVFTSLDAEPGEDRRAALHVHLRAARAAVLLVSPAFLASEAIRTDELPHLLQRRHDDGLVVLSLLLRPCAFAEARIRYPDPASGPEEVALSTLQPIDDRPLSTLSEAEQDQVLVALTARLFAVASPAAPPSLPAARPVRSAGPPAPLPLAPPPRLWRLAAGALAVCAALAAVLRGAASHGEVSTPADLRAAIAPAPAPASVALDLGLPPAPRPAADPPPTRRAPARAAGAGRLIVLAFDGSRVQVAGAEHRAHAGVATDPGGALAARAAFPGLPPGTYHVSCSVPGCPGCAPTKLEATIHDRQELQVDCRSGRGGAPQD